MNAEQMRIIDRIRKLLRLGRSSHKAEAEAAIAKAHELAQEAGIAIEDVDADQEAREVTHEAGGTRRRTTAHGYAFSILENHFGVQVLFNRATGATYVGPSVNIAIARHVEAFLLREHAKAMAEFLRVTKRAGRCMRRSYTVGWFVAIHQTLEARPIRNDSRAQAEKSEAVARIEAYIEKRFRLKETKTEKRRLDQCAARIGLYAGRRINLSRPVTTPEGCGELTAGRKELSA